MKTSSGCVTKTAKVPQAYLYSQFFMFFFIDFFFFCFFAPFFLVKKRTQKQVRQRYAVVLMPVIHFNSKLALTTTCSVRVLSKQRHLALHLTHSDVMWHKPGNDLGRSGEITTKVVLKLDNDLWSMHYV